MGGRGSRRVTYLSRTTRTSDDAVQANKLIIKTLGPEYTYEFINIFFVLSFYNELMYQI